jgi:predicted alpha/beta-hydrolase family hydrolase
VVALAFPVHPPGRPDADRSDELLAVSCPLLVVQGRGDAFGQPPEASFDGIDRVLARVPGPHALTADTSAVAAAVSDFLRRF